MSLALGITIFTNVINATLLAFVIQKQKSASRLHLTLFGASIFFLLTWSIMNYLADSSMSVNEALWWTRLSFIPAFFMGWLIFVFSWVFPIRRGPWWVIWVYFGGILFFSLTALTNVFIKTVELDMFVGVSGVALGSMYAPTMVFCFVTIFHSLYNFVQNYRTLLGQQRQQVLFVLFGWMFFFGFAMVTNAVLPYMLGNANWSKFGPLGSIFMVSFVSYAILRYGFLNIRVIIQRGLVYSTLLSLIVAMYIGFLFLTHILFHGTTTASITLSAFITTLVGIIGVPSLTQYFKRVTAKVFFREGYDYATVLGSLIEILNTHLAQDSIVKKTTSILEKALKAEQIAFLFPPSDGVVPVWSVVAIPLRSNKKHIGTLHLGKKRSDESFTEEDIHLLQTFTDSAATALDKAVLYRQVKEHAETLERKVEERTREIQDIQKGQESMMLEISHGLQTPLTIMKGELFFLRRKGYETEKIETIDSSIDRISFFISRLLSLYQLETTVHMSPEPFNLSELLARLVASFVENVRGREIEIESHIAENVHVVGDAHSIEEVCANLIENAIKYSHPARRNTIRINLKKENGVVYMCVSDTGIGIRREHLSNLFSKFYRVKEQDTKYIQGTGLGLVIAKKIVMMHSGSIELASEYGKGTTIVVTFPSAH